MTKKWVALALFGLVMALVFFALFRLIGAAQSMTPACVDAKSREQIRELTLQAIDQAFQSNVISLFSIWTKDFAPEPTRAMVGMANNINAWKRARSNALNWNPPTC